MEYLKKLTKDKENLEADLRLKIMDFFNEYPEVSLRIDIEKQWEGVDIYGITEKILTRVDVKLNAKITI